jgi:hypothetical protein
MWTLIIFGVGVPFPYPIWMSHKIASIGGFTTIEACQKRAAEIERTAVGTYTQCVKGAWYD